VDADTVQAVINDLKGEMPTLAANEAGAQRAARKPGAGDDRALEQLDRRVSKMERSIVNILKMSRELLTLAQDRHQDKREG
jgi:hypothetical protein